MNSSRAHAYLESIIRGLNPTTDPDDLYPRLTEILARQVAGDKWLDFINKIQSSLVETVSDGDLKYELVQKLAECVTGGYCESNTGV